MTAPAAADKVLPFRDPSRRSRLVKVAGWLLGTAVVIVVLHLLGIDVIGWLQDLWDQIKEVPAGYIVAALTAQTGADGPRRALLLRHPERGLPRASRAPPDRGGLRGRRGDEQLPAGEHRHVRDAAHVRGHHPGLHLRRRVGGLPRPEDLLHARRDVRLPLPLPLRPGLLRRSPERPRRPRGEDDPRARGRRLPDRRRGAHLLAPGQEPVGRRRRPAARSSRSRSATRPASSCPRSSRGSASWP